MTATHACFRCLRRSWLLERMGGHLQRQRAALEQLLTLEDGELIQRCGGASAPRLTAEYAAYSHQDADDQVAAGARDGIALTCGHDEAFPERLRELDQLTPALLADWGGGPTLEELLEPASVAIVGTRRPSQAGRLLAEQLACELSASGITVVSGLAFGIDSAAHEGALRGGGRTLAVLAGPPHRPTPRRQAPLHRQVGRHGRVVSEFGAGARSWPWQFVSRNRIIAGLATLTVVVEAAPGSGSLVTVRAADRLGRPVGVVPGPVGAPQSAGTNELLVKARAGRQSLHRRNLHAVRHAQDVLDLLFGEGERRVSAPPPSPVSAAEAELLARIQAGAAHVSLIDPVDLVHLAGLELKGRIRRGAGGTLLAVGG